MDNKRKIIKISSLQNVKLKSALKLKDKKHRKEKGLFGVEGLKEIQCALDNKYKVSEVFFCSDLLSHEGSRLLEDILGQDKEFACHELDRKCFVKLVMREQSGGLYIVFLPKERKDLDLYLRKESFFLALEGIEKPGNLGAIIRSADGAGVDGVFLLSGCTDIYQAQVIRNSLGSVFSLPIFSMETKNFFKNVNRYHLTTVAAALKQDSISYSSYNYRKKGIVVLLGSEAFGLSSYCLENSDALIKIPMNGVNDSLNVSVAAAVILYEARRQLDEKTL